MTAAKVALSTHQRRACWGASGGLSSNMELIATSSAIHSASLAVAPGRQDRTTHPGGHWYCLRSIRWLPQLAWVGQVDARHPVLRVEVDIGLVEPVEQDEPVGTGFDHLSAKWAVPDRYGLNLTASGTSTAPRTSRTTSR
jgi:hypothetical protein